MGAREVRQLNLSIPSDAFYPLNPPSDSCSARDIYQGRRLNSPNDAVVKSDGSIYFTDPPYGINPEEQELEFQGVYRLNPDGQGPTLLVDNMECPTAWPSPLMRGPFTSPTRPTGGM